MKTKAVILLMTLVVSACSQQRSDITKITPLYQVKAPSKPGDWLETNNESYMDIESYQHSNPTRADGNRKIIYIYSLGKNSAAEDSLLKITCKYLKLIFHLETKIGGTFPESCIPDTMKRDWGSEFQVNTHFVLDTLVNMPIPADAAVAICFTRYDLYPSEDWNFVFGQAYLRERTGVWSFNRYGDANNTEEFNTVLRRTLKVATHETGHMFSIKHCIRYECDMNGSNSLNETDASPLYYCPDCLEKLSWNLGFEIPGHFKALLDFYTKYGFNEEAEFIEKNLRKLKQK